MRPDIYLDFLKFQSDSIDFDKLEIICKKAEALDIFKKYFNFKFDEINDMLLISIQAKEDENEYDCTACANIKLLSYNPNIYNENAKEEFDFLKDVLKDE